MVATSRRSMPHSAPVAAKASSSSLGLALEARELLTAEGSMVTSGNEVWSQLASTRAAPKKIMRINALITAYVPDPFCQQP